MKFSLHIQCHRAPPDGRWWSISTFSSELVPKESLNPFGANDPFNQRSVLLIQPSWSLATSRSSGRASNRALQLLLRPAASSWAFGCSVHDNDSGEVKSVRVFRLQSVGYSAQLLGGLAGSFWNTNGDIWAPFSHGSGSELGRKVHLRQQNIWLLGFQQRNVFREAFLRQNKQGFNAQPEENSNTFTVQQGELWCTS